MNESTPACTVDGCQDPREARGYCTRHYSRWRRKGSPVAPKAVVIPGERWLPIPGHEGVYEASDQGRIRSLFRWEEGADGLPRRRFAKVLKVQRRARYSKVLLYRDRVPIYTFVHVAIMEAFVGPKPPGMEVNHKNRKGHDNRLVNLEYVTHAQNMQHAKMTGVRNNTKLTPDGVREIRKLRASGVPAKVIAERFNVGVGCVWDVLNGRTWSYVD